MGILDIFLLGPSYKQFTHKGLGSQQWMWGVAPEEQDSSDPLGFLPFLCLLSGWGQTQWPEPKTSKTATLPGAKETGNQQALITSLEKFPSPLVI